MVNKKQGFASLSPAQLTIVSKKGGRVKVKKGFAANPELARQAGSKGGIAKRDNRKEEHEQNSIPSGNRSTNT